MDPNTHTLAKVEKIYLDNDNDFTKLKKEVLSDIQHLQNKFNEVTSGRATTRFNQSPTKQKRNDLVLKHYRRTQKVHTQVDLVKRGSEELLQMEDRESESKENSSMRNKSAPIFAESVFHGS